MIYKRVLGMILCMLMITTVLSVQPSSGAVKRLYIDGVVGDFRGVVLFIFRNVGDETIIETIDYIVHIEGGRFGKSIIIIQGNGIYQYHLMIVD